MHAVAWAGSTVLASITSVETGAGAAEEQLTRQIPEVIEKAVFVAAISSKYLVPLTLSS